MIATYPSGAPYCDACDADLVTWDLPGNGVCPECLTSLFDPADSDAAADTEGRQ